MTPAEVAILVGALAGLIGALQGWLISRSNQHEALLNGAGSPRITEIANDAIAASRHVTLEPAPAPALTPAQAARRAALVAELQTLDPGALAPTH